MLSARGLAAGCWLLAAGVAGPGLAGVSRPSLWTARSPAQAAHQTGETSRCSANVAH